ncbi:hypothetical protein AVEN_93153-1 [Araneus ventricosus]|uniref:Uncharacterized protein n=1 Tax=Araneus ventricosus TaxID=182803 RepID=A0A4Y2LQ89_ARAVE|nr:hypothetical protein AVEN_93153-1 [Araneus ventricosus]
MLSSLSRSARQHSSELGFTKRSARRIWNLDLQFHPYILAVVQQLKPVDYAQSLNFAHEMEKIRKRLQNFFSNNGHHMGDVVFHS